MLIFCRSPGKKNSSGLIREMGRAGTCRAGDSVTGPIILGRAAAIKSTKAQCRGAPQTLSHIHKRFGGCTFPTGQLPKAAGCLRSPLQRCLCLGTTSMSAAGQTSASPGLYQDGLGAL